MPARCAKWNYEPSIAFQMAGLGYTHPQWGHGCDKGAFTIDDETWKLADLDLSEPHLFHVQQVCKVTLNGKQTGYGILEHAAFGPDAPSRFRGRVDVYRKPSQ